MQFKISNYFGFEIFISNKLENVVNCLGSLQISETFLNFAKLGLFDIGNPLFLVMLFITMSITLSTDYYNQLINKLNQLNFDVIFKNYSLEKLKLKDQLLARELKIKDFEKRLFEQGCYVNPCGQISNKLKFLYDRKILSGDSVKIKLTADGTILSRTTKVINFCFNVINEGQKTAGVNGVYPLGIFRVEKEDYESVKTWLRALWDEIKTMTTFSFQNKIISIVYYFSSDWKMMSIVLGLYSAFSNFPCLRCECPKEQLFSTQISKKRSNEKGSEIIKKSKKNSKFLHLGYKVEPVLPEMPFKNFIIDSLHLFLRISDTLFELLIHDLCRIDKFSDSSIFNENKHCELNKMPAGIQKMIDFNQKNLSV
ncbi:hypothetical protein BpHYR1_004120 [Brachionus plicatilis]|uniref:Uncharacterized protein n=1 Tax=Brachionus plicatilis TaxID=10195 RepID=A0A3M7R0N2_BRAPC|nr:hypothetical protein BpHYR1_004120 [Brachionus plicatilis]